MRLAQLVSGNILVQRVVICVLAGLLVSYHTYTLFDLYLGSGTDLYGTEGHNAHPYFVSAQSILRAFIVLSLILVVMNRRLGLYGMWAAILTLVATHYWAHFFDLPFHFLEGRHPLSYLKGLIVPTIITLLYYSMHVHRQTHRPPGDGES